MENNKIRNIAILGHLQSGKTSLVESLYSLTTGAPKGSVEKGNTISDYTPEEKAKMNSIKSAIVPINYNDYKINLIDVPGSDDFIGEAVAAVHVVKGAVLVLDAQAGVEVQTVKHWNMLKVSYVRSGCLFYFFPDHPDVKEQFCPVNCFMASQFIVAELDPVKDLADKMPFFNAEASPDKNFARKIYCFDPLAI